MTGTGGNRIEGNFIGTGPGGNNFAVVRPIDDAIVECPETVIARLSASANYSIGAPSNATVTILDKVVPTVTVTTPDPFASENGPSSGNFVIKRTGCTNTSLIVGLTIGGTASNGTDYQRISNSVTIRAGARFVNILVKPIADALVEGSETVIATITARSTYTVGSSSNATVTIADLATVAASKTVMPATAKPPKVSTASSPQALTAAPWDLRIRGSDHGLGFVSFHDDGTLTGYGISTNTVSLCLFSGAWSYGADGQVHGSFVARIDDEIVMDGALTAIVGEGKLAAKIVHGTGTLKLRGVPISDQPDLSGRWLAEVENADGTLKETYEFSASEEFPGLFRLEGEGASAIHGGTIASSRNRVSAYMQAESFESRSLSGNFDAAADTMVLHGVDQHGAKVRITAVRQ